MPDKALDVLKCVGAKMDAYFHYRVIKIIGSALLFFLISSCGSDNAKTPIENSNSSTLNPTKGVTQEESFYVRLYDDGKYPYYMNQKNNYDKKCEITSGAASQNIECIYHSHDLRVWLHCPGRRRHLRGMEHQAELPGPVAFPAY